MDFTDPVLFVANLKFTYHLMAASENLLTKAIELSEGQPYQAYFQKHFLEEVGHAQMLADDLASVGIHVVGTTPHAAAMYAAGTQYYAIFHQSPVTLFGYMLALEATPIPLEIIAELEALHCKSLLRCLRHHATHDIDHSEDLMQEILKLSTEDQKLVEQSAIRTATALSTVEFRYV